MNPRFISASLLFWFCILSTASFAQTDTIRVQKKNSGNETIPDSIYAVLEQMPKFTNSDSSFNTYIAQNVMYPNAAKEQGIAGTVYVSFIVDKDGTVNEVRIVRSVNPLLDSEVIRVVQSSPKWVPGKLNGQPVRTKMFAPVKFTLDGAPGSTNDTTIYASPQSQAQFPGGESAFEQYLVNNIRYPRSAMEADKSGTVYVYFVVEKDGSITHITVQRGVPGVPEFDAEAVRVIAAMPKWIPGKMNDHPVRTGVVRPVKFILN